MIAITDSAGVYSRIPESHHDIRDASTGENSYIPKHLGCKMINSLIAVIHIHAPDAIAATQNLETSTLSGKEALDHKGDRDVQKKINEGGGPHPSVLESDPLDRILGCDPAPFANMSSE